MILNLLQSKRFVLLLMFAIFGHGIALGQSGEQNLEALRLKFENYSENKRIEIISNWFNQSVRLEIPEQYKFSFNNYQQKYNINSIVFEKRILPIKILFNDELQIIDRIIASEFLLQDDYEHLDLKNLIKEIREDLLTKLLSK